MITRPTPIDIAHRREAAIDDTQPMTAIQLYREPGNPDTTGQNRWIEDRPPTRDRIPRAWINSRFKRGIERRTWYSDSERLAMQAETEAAMITLSRYQSCLVNAEITAIADRFREERDCALNTIATLAVRHRPRVAVPGRHRRIAG